MTEVHWQNRIVGEGEEAPDQLLASPWNFRIHPHTQEQALTEVLRKVGWVTRIVVNQRTQRLIDGHLRVVAAISAGEEKVPVTYVDLSEEEERLVIASLDPLSAMAGTDSVKLQELVRDIDALLDDGPLKKELERLAQMKPIDLSGEAEESESKGEEPKTTICPKCGHCFAP